MPKQPESLVATTVDAFMEAALDPTRWDAAMDALARVSGSYGAVLLPVNGRTAAIPMSPILGPTTDAYIKGGWATRDARDALHSLINERVVVDLDYISLEGMQRNPYYREFLEPFGLRWFAGMRLRSASYDGILSIQRSIAQGPFSSDELANLTPLIQRLPKVMALVEALGYARAEAALNAFEASGTAVLLIDRYGRVCRMNAIAEKVLNRHFHISRGKIVATDREAARQLEQAIYQLANGLLTDAATAVAFMRPGQLPMVTYPLRMPAVSSDILSPCQAVVILRDPEIDRPAIPAALARAFKLTPAETRLALGLTMGKGLQLLAVEFGISYETARSQLRALFHKTETKSQAQLVAMLLKLLR